MPSLFGICLSLTLVHGVTVSSRLDSCADRTCRTSDDTDDNSHFQLRLAFGSPKPVSGLRTDKSSLAICVSGGLRGADNCAASLVDSMIRPNVGHLRKVDLFVATWSDRQCSSRVEPVTDKEVRELYEKAGAQVTRTWIGDGDNEGIPDRFKDTWESHNQSDYPYGNMVMLDGTHHMAKLWQRCLDMVPKDTDVIVHVRPDQQFPQKYFWSFRPGADSKWQVEIKNTEMNTTWVKTLDDNTVYMSENKYHKPDQGETGSIPDDRLGFGLSRPMRGVFATLDADADNGEYDISELRYRKRWGPVQPDSPNDERLRKDMNPNTDIRNLNPQHAWVRERYPEKLLMHHILHNKFNYSLISDDSISPYDVVPLERDC